MVKAYVNYTKGHFDALFGALMRRNRKSDIFWGIVMALCVILVAAAIIYVKVNGIELTPKAKGRLLIFGAAFAFYAGSEIVLLTIPRRAARKQRRSGRTIDFVIGADGIDTESDGEKYSFTWERTHSAERSGGYFVIFKNQKSAFMISDSDITEGTADELDALFAEKLGERYKRIDTAQRRHGR